MEVIMDMKEIRFTMMLLATFAILVGYLMANAEINIPKLIVPTYILGVITILFPLINIWEDKNDSK